MHNGRFLHPIWELDPRHEAQPTYDDYERVFLAAYSEAFHLPASPERIRPYLTRYLRLYVVAPWVHDFADRKHADPVAEELVGAPLDTLFDWRRVCRWLESTLPLYYICHDPVDPDRAHLEA